MSGSNFNFHEYRDENELMRDFRRHWSDPDAQRRLPNYIFNSLLDDAILSVAAEAHQQRKSGSLFALEGVKEENRIVHEHCTDVEKANCPNCDRVVAAARFAPHLEKCMGMGRNSARVSSRRIASRGDTNYFGTVVSDDEDDVDWSGEKKRGEKKKLPKLASTVTKKTGKSS